MPSTYTLNNGIELIGTGEQSGTWGDTTNTNLELLDSALDGQVTVTLASAGSSGSPNALPISDGAASNGRNRMVVFDDSSDLGATAYVQLTPNDAEKIIYIRNDLSGSRSIILFQGTYNASNDYEVPAGTTAVVYFDGAGSGAVAANVFNNAYFDSLRLGGVSVTAILDEDNMASDSATALATQQSIKAYVDAQVGANNELSEVLANGNTTGGTDIAVSSGDDITFADSSKAIFGAGSDLQIYHSGSHSFIEDQGTGFLYIKTDRLNLQNAAGTENLIQAISDGAVNLYYDNAAKLATTSTGVDITGGVTADSRYIIQGTSNAGTSDISYGSYANGAWINGLSGSSSYLAVGGSGVLKWNSTGVDITGTLTSDGLTVDGDVLLNGDRDLHLVGSNPNAGTPFQYGEITLGDVNTGQYNNHAKIVSKGNFANQTSLEFHTSDNNSSPLRMEISKIGDINFYEDTGTTPKFEWSASSERLTLSTSGAYALDVRASGTSSATMAQFSNVNGSDKAAIRLDANGDGELVLIDAGNNEDVVISSGGDTYFNGGNVGIGVSSPAGALHVSRSGLEAGITLERTASATAKFTMAANDGKLVFTDQNQSETRMVIDSSGNVGIGTSSPAYNLVVSAAGASGIEFGPAYSGTANLVQHYSRSGGVYVDAVNDAAQHRFNISGTERMRIDSSGNVGIGTSSPTYRLEVSGDIAQDEGNVRNTISSTGTGFEFTANAESANVGRNFTFSSSTSGGSVQERMRIDSSGNVGIGTTSPVTPLHIFTSGNTAATFHSTTDNSNIVFTDASTTANVAIGAVSGDNFRVQLNNLEAMRIINNGNVGIGTSSPAHKLHVAGATTPEIIVEDTTNNVKAVLGADNSVGRIGTDTNHPVTFRTNDTERMRIDSSGSLLVGTTAQPNGTVDGFQASSNGATYISADGVAPVALYRGTSDGNILNFHKNGTAVGSIASKDGDLAIGTGTIGVRFLDGSSAIVPQNHSTNSGTDGLLDLGVGAARFKDLYLAGSTYLSGSAATTFLRVGTDPDGTFSSGTDVKHGTIITSTDSTGVRTHNQFRNPNGAVGSITTSGSATAYNTSSDYRLKTDAQPMTGASDRVLALKPVNFEWIADGTRVDGFLAHEAQAVVPEAVTGDKDAMRDEEYEVTPAVLDEDGNVVTEAVMGTRSVPDYQGIDQSKLVPLLTAALQEALTKIDALETRITALEG